MEVRNWDHCFFVPNDISINCDCHKVYFKVYIDFQPQIIAICKDFYNMRFKEILHERFSEREISVFSYSRGWHIINNNKQLTEYMKTNIIETIIDECVEELFGSYFPKYGLDKSNKDKIGYVAVKVIERPEKYIKIGCIHLVEFFSDNNLENIRDVMYNSILNDLWDDFGIKIIAFMKRYSKYKNALVRFKQLVDRSRPVFNNEACLLLFQTFINKKKNGTN